MNRKDGDDPNHLEELGDLLNTEILNKLNCLLERLHLLEDEKMKETLVRRSQLKNEKGIEINIYEKGSWHVDNVENQNFYGEKWTENFYTAKSESSMEGEGKGTDLPEALSTEEAMVLWEKVLRAGYVDDNYQPMISRTMSALLADAMAKQLGISEKWKVFEALWNRKNMYRDYYKALNLQQSLTFQDEIKRKLR